MREKRDIEIIRNTAVFPFSAFLSLFGDILTATQQHRSTAKLFFLLWILWERR